MLADAELDKAILNAFAEASRAIGRHRGTEAAAASWYVSRPGAMCVLLGPVGSMPTAAPG